MISSITHSLEEFYHNPVTWTIATVFFFLIIAIRLYCKGGVCTVDRNLTGQVIVITGGSAGIGKETVKALASKDCTIIFGARDKEKSERLVKQIQRNNTGSKVYFFPLDLADKKSIQVFSEIINDTCDKIDVLINNAGLTLPDRRQTKDGFEMSMGVNHFGHFYLTYLLWSLIKAAQRPRIINVSSSLHNSKRKPQIAIDFDDINYKNHFDHQKAYARSKLANILFSKELQRKMDEAKICGFAYSLHPGVIMTEIAREFGLKVTILKIIFWPLIALCFKSQKEGAQTTLYLVLEDDSKLQKGGYYGDCKLQKSSDFSQDISNASRLWKVSEEQLNIEFKI